MQSKREAGEVLENHCYTASKKSKVIFPEWYAIQSNIALSRIAHTCQQLDDGGLARAIRADKGYNLAGPYAEGEMMERRSGAARSSRVALGNMVNGETGARSDGRSLRLAGRCDSD